MKLIVVGRMEDVRGFALAGVEIAHCETQQAADAVLRSLGSDPDVGVLLVPAWIERAAPAAIARVRERRGAPVVLVLPGDQETVN